MIKGLVGQLFLQCEGVKVNTGLGVCEVFRAEKHIGGTDDTSGEQIFGEERSVADDRTGPRELWSECFKRRRDSVSAETEAQAHGFFCSKYEI